MNLNDKICVITGSGNGIGEQCALKFAEYGATLFLIDIDEKIKNISESIEKKYKRKVRFLVGDVTSSTTLNLIESTIIDDLKRVDVLFNNAGVIRLSDDISEMDEEDWDLQVNVNLKSIYLVLKKIIPIMKNQNYGNILNTASMTGSVVGMGGLAGYCASKAGVVGLTQSVALELAKYNIRCNAISPGAIDTDFYNNEFLKNNTIDDLESGKKYMESVIPFGRYGNAEDIANVALFLASELSGYVTGQNIIIDGGYSTQ